MIVPDEMAEFVWGVIAVAILWTIVEWVRRLRVSAKAPEPIPEPPAFPSAPRAVEPSPVPAPVPWPPEAEPEIIILPEYEIALEAVRNGCPATFVTGKAGTGKSTMIGFLRAAVPSCAVVAPTGIAAMNVEGVTIHSFFQSSASNTGS